MRWTSWTPCMWSHYAWKTTKAFFAASTVVLLIAGCNRVTEEPHELRINTPEGEVVAHDTEVEATPQTITVVEGDDLAWLQSLDDTGPEFVRHV